MKTEPYDVIVLGAGASGLMCAAAAGRRGRKVLVLEGSAHAGSKILVSGGGRCNFSNRQIGPENYLSENPHFCRSALSRFGPEDICARLDRHRIRYHQEDSGRLFCDDGARKILDALLSECRASGVTIRTGCRIRKTAGAFRVDTDDAEFNALSLVVATGGKSWSKLGASEIGYEIARQYGLQLVPAAPALVPLVLNREDRRRFGMLSGLSVRGRVTCGSAVFEDDILFTHRGLSGPAILQISSYWREGDAVVIDLLPQLRLEEMVALWKTEHPKAELKNLIGKIIPKRLVERLLDNSRPVNQIGERQLNELSEKFHGWKIIPAGTEGFDKAEVTRGGVDTAEISSKTFVARKVPGLYFVGEVLDVTGWLGGYNLHWAWASGHCCGLGC